MVNNNNTCVCICVYIYIYMYIHTCIHIYNKLIVVPRFARLLARSIGRIRAFWEAAEVCAEVLCVSLRNITRCYYRYDIHVYMYVSNTSLSLYIYIYISLIHIHT